MTHEANFTSIFWICKSIFSIIKQDHKISGERKAQEKYAPYFLSVKKKSIKLDQEVYILLFSFSSLRLKLHLELNFLFSQISPFAVLNYNANKTE
jgi:hypothetical protein